jgi:hypothetical protein
MHKKECVYMKVYAFNKTTNLKVQKVKSMKVSQNAKCEKKNKNDIENK